MTDKPSETTKAFQNRPSQAESNYVPLSVNKGEACANCRFFMNDGCWIIEDYPEPIIATGYCDRWEATPSPEAPLTEIIADAVIESVNTLSETIAESMPMYVEMSNEKLRRKPFVDRVRDLFRPKQVDAAFSVFKGTDDQWHWHAVFTNNFEDLEGEILTEKAHDNYIQRLDMGLVPMPSLMAWHTVGTEHGAADIIWRDNHLVHAIGHFDDTPMAQKAIKFYQKNAGKIKMSHGFVAPEWAFDGKHYDDYNTIEITTLPPYAAANPYTSFEELLKMQTERSEEKSRYLAELIGKENLAAIDARSGEVNKGLEELGVKHKDHAQVTPDAAKPVDEAEVKKALPELISDMVTMQSEMIALQKLQAKALTDKDAEIATLKTEKDTQVSQLQKDIEAIKAQVNMPPSRASQSLRTTVTKEDGLGDKLPQAPDTFFGDLLTPTPTRNGANQ